MAPQRISIALAMICFVAESVLSQEIYSISETYRPSTTSPKVTCPPRYISNGRAIPAKDSYKVGDRVGFKCSNGFQRFGIAVSECMDSGLWGSDVPDCKEKYATKSCPARALKSGYYSPKKFSYDNKDVVVYSCEDGYILKGSEAAACFDGQWTVTLPICEGSSKKCPFRKFMHGITTPQQDFYEDFDIVVYSCETGYKIQGVQGAGCFDGKWSEELPFCESSGIFPEHDIYCPPPTIKNGVFSPEPANNQGYLSGSSVNFRCKGANTLKGASRATCLESGKWDHTPVCKAGCRKPRINNGFYETDATLFGAYFEPGHTVIFHCNPAYSIKGEMSATCRKNGRWSAKFPICEELKIVISEVGCPPPAFPQGPYTPMLTGSKAVYSIGERVVFSCAGQYHVVGSNYATCLASGQWTPFPSCSDECVPMKVQHGTVNAMGGSFRYSSQIRLNCNSGYLPIGPRQATCLPGGVWSAHLKCSDGCFAPNIPNMRITPEPVKGGNVFEFGKRIRFQCDAGLSTSVTQAECRGKNKWDKTLPKCSVLSARSGCAMPQLPEGLILKSQHMTVFPYKAQLEFECTQGFSMIGSAVSICRKHLKGLYGGLDPSPPVCNRAKCGSPGKPQNGRFRDGQKNSYVFGDVVYFVCDDKHIMSGSDHITCQADGQFSDIPPRCQPPSCKVECLFVEGRECQCDAACRIRGDCCYDFEQHCRKLFY